MVTKYSTTSPYHYTPIVGDTFLDVWVNRPIEKNPTDVYWEITPPYARRPDLLANDIYNLSALWWVFAQRNPDVLRHPVFDFMPGTLIYVPKLSDLKRQLGF